MRPDRQQRELLKAMLHAPVRERTFAQLFPWRNVGRAVMLLVVILGIVALKRSTGSLLTRIGDLWSVGGARRAVPARAASAQATPGFNTHLGPGLRAVPSAAGTRADPSR